MNNKQIITTIVIAVVVGAAGFFGGYKFAQSKTPASRAGQFAAAGRTGAAGGNAARRAGGGFTSGQIISSDSKSITVQLPNNGGSKIVFYAPSTQINKPTTVDASQLTTGSNVIVTGTANSDGSITAQNIQIRPAGQPGFGGPGGGQSSTTPGN